MDLSKHLRYFLTVAEELHFGHAADALGIAQPPLSQAIRRLERELDVELFDRSRRQVRLTVAGDLLVDEARAHLAGERRMRTLMRKARDGTLGGLRLGVPPDTPAVRLQFLLRRMGQEAPGLDVDVHELTTDEQIRLLADRGLDVAVVYHPVEATDLRFGPTVDITLGVILPRTAALARASEIDLADLTGYPLIIAPRATASGWYDDLVQTCHAHGFVPDHIRHARDPAFQFGLVLAGMGVVLAPEVAARVETRVAWRPLRGRPLRRTISAAWPADAGHPAAPTVAALVAWTLAARRDDGVQLTGPDGSRPWEVVYDVNGRNGT